jgi:phenylpropionate dioxygenase-like ring-hydroxylating dioxygenase large terminal subunit
VACVEEQGLVFVSQAGTQADDIHLEALPPLLGPGWQLLASTEREIPVNWKIFAEGFLEGYHIRETHPQTFYPVQFDNVNVVETFGRNSRIAFPYRAINKLRTLPPAERSVDGKLTYVYHLFPNVVVATFPANRFIAILEPLATDRTLLVSYVLGRPGEVTREQPTPKEPSTTLRGLDLVDAGAVEDREVACSIQRGLASGANEFFEFGRFEGAIGHFHRVLDAALDGTPWQDRA